MIKILLVILSILHQSFIWSSRRQIPVPSAPEIFSIAPRLNGTPYFDMLGKTHSLYIIIISTKAYDSPIFTEFKKLVDRLNKHKPKDLNYAEEQLIASYMSLVKSKR